MTSKPFDVYSSLMEIPFDAAAYCRLHKFAPASVELSRAIAAVHAARTQAQVAQDAVDAAGLRLKRALQGVDVMMQRNPT